MPGTSGSSGSLSPPTISSPRSGSSPSTIAGGCNDSPDRFRSIGRIEPQLGVDGLHELPVGAEPGSEPDSADETHAAADHDRVRRADARGEQPGEEAPDRRRAE